MQRSRRAMSRLCSEVRSIHLDIIIVLIAFVRFSDLASKSPASSSLPLIPIPDIFISPYSSLFCTATSSSLSSSNKSPPVSPPLSSHLLGWSPIIPSYSILALLGSLVAPLTPYPRSTSSPQPQTANRALPRARLTRRKPHEEVQLRFSPGTGHAVVETSFDYER